MRCLSEYFSLLLLAFTISYLYDFLTVFGPAIALTVLLGAVGEAIIVRVVSEYVLYVASTIMPFLPWWLSTIVNCLGIVACVVMAWNVLPPPRGISKSLYSFITALMYIAFWEIVPLSKSVQNIASWLHSTAIAVGSAFLGKTRLETFISGIASTIAETILSILISQVAPILATIFVCLTFFVEIVVVYMISGVFTGLVYKLGQFMSKIVKGHPAWFMLSILFIADIISSITTFLIVLMFAIFIGTLIPMIAIIMSSKMPWTAISQLASGFVAIIFSIFLSVVLRFILGNVNSFIDTVFGIRPPLFAIAFSILLALSTLVSFIGLAPLILLAVGVYILGIEITIFTVCAGGIPRRARQLQQVIATIITLFVMSHLLGPFLEPVRQLVNLIMIKLH